MQDWTRLIQWIGLDVSSRTFTAAFTNAFTNETVRPKQEKFELNRRGVRQLLSWARDIGGGEPFGIAMETTGSYSERLAKLISDERKDLHVSLCNAGSISHYVKSFTEAKSDKADASYIARYAAERRPAPRLMTTPEIEMLRAATRDRERLVEQRVRMLEANATIDSKFVLNVNDGVIKAIDKAIAELDAKIRDIVMSNAEIKREIDIMVTCPGVAFLSAATIYAELGSLTQYTRKQLSALSGVCPVRIESGTSVRRSRISHRGSKALRRILFLDALFAIRKVPAIRALHEKLMTRVDSSKLTARCACMRKLLLTLRGMVVSQRAFDPDYKPESYKKNELTA